MRLTYHRLAARDVRQILEHYEAEAGALLVERFLAALQATLGKAVSNPNRFPPLGARLRRANLDGFPYHVIYEPELDGIRVLIVRHHRRDPAWGMERR
jgi:plasmid stabilization system protein ParE